MNDVGALVRDTLAGAERVLILFSGGRDSSCLIDAAACYGGADVLEALHVNYHLRPGSDDDERHCRAVCAELGVPLHVLHAGAPSANVQAWARELRYGYAREWARAGGVYATAHTASDQVETILYRLAASPGRRALLGMARRAGALVRPLLGVTREQTTAYCRERGLQWRDDPANDDPRYARARVRNELLPALRAIHPAAEANVLRTARLLRGEHAALRALVDELLGGREEVELARLEALPAALARLVVQELAEAVAGVPVPQAAGRFPEIIALGRRERGTGALDVGNGVRALVRDGVLSMGASQGLAAPRVD